jgi:hypothetical protein
MNEAISSTSGNTDTLISGLASRFVTNKLSILFVCWLLAKYVLFTKVYAAIGFVKIDNEFFPEWLYYIRPIYAELAVIALFVVGTRWSFSLALPITAMLIVHPQTFGDQHYVMSFYMFLWLATMDRSNGSIMFGRITLSFLYMSATIGKLTPGWISGDHMRYLHHLHQFPYLILAGEFLFGIAFLFPFYLGILIPLCIVAGMIFSISFAIFDAVGPIVGMLLTFVIFRESKNSPVSVTLPAGGAAILKYLRLPNVTIAIGANVTASDADGEYAGTTALAALFARIPLIAFLCPLLAVRTRRQLLAYQ